jgi:hypothetical protein
VLSCEQNDAKMPWNWFFLIVFLWLVKLAVVTATSACHFFLWSHTTPTEIANIWKSVC